MRVLKGQCHFATLLLSYTFGSFACCESEHFCPSLLLHPGSHWAGEDRTMSPCLLLLPGIPLNGDVQSNIWSWAFLTRIRLRYYLLFQSRDYFHCMQIWSENRKSIGEAGRFVCLFPETLENALSSSDTLLPTFSIAFKFSCFILGKLQIKNSWPQGLVDCRAVTAKTMICPHCCVHLRDWRV